MNKIIKGMLVALTAIVGTIVARAATVGQTLTFSSVEQAVSATSKNGGAYGALALKIPVSADLPPKSVVTLKTIKLGLRSGNYTSDDQYLVVGGIGAEYANATPRTVSETADFGGVKAITFGGYNRDLKVGEAYTCQFRAGAGGNVNGRTQNLQVFGTTSNVGDIISVNNSTVWSLIYEITVEVKSLGEVVDVETIEAAQPIKDNFLNVLMWLDAKDEATITKNTDNKVTKWADKSAYKRDALPTAQTSDNTEGFKTNFGDYTTNTEIGDLGEMITTNNVTAFNMGGIASGVDMSFERMTTIRTAFFVMDIAANQNAFWLGDKDSYHFHRNGANYGNTQGKLGNANTKIWCDGVRVPSNTGTRVPDGLHVYAMVIPSNCDACHLSLDRNVTDGNTQNGSRHGGRALSELIVLDSALTDEQVASVSSYLYNKWFEPVQIAPEGNYTTDELNTAAGANPNVVLTMKPGTTLTLNAETTKSVVVKSTGTVTIPKSSTALTAEQFAKYDFNQVADLKVILDSANAIAISAPAENMTYRVEGTTALPYLPWYATAFNGTVELACPVTEITDAVTGNDFGTIFHKKNYIFAEGFTMTTGTRFAVGNQGNAGQVLTINGGTMNLTHNGAATGNAGDALTPLLLAHWPGVATFDIAKGTLDMSAGVAMFGWDGDARMTIGGGEGAAIVKAKGFKQGKNNASTLTLGENGTLELGSAGLDLGSNKSVVLAGGTLKAVESSTMTIAKGITVNADSTIAIGANDVVLAAGPITGEGTITKTGTGNLKLGAASSRPKLGAVEGTMTIVATANEIADGAIVIVTTETEYAANTFSVVNGADESIESSVMVENNQLKISLVTQGVTESGAVSTWNPDWVGEVVVKGTAEAPVTMTVDADFPQNVTTVKVLGDVTISYVDGATASSVSIQPQAGSTVTVTGAPENALVLAPVNGSALTVANGATIKLAANSAINGLVTIEKNATLELTVNNIINTGSRFELHNHGTLELGDTYQEIQTSNDNLNTFSQKFIFYSGSLTHGTRETESLSMEGGYGYRFFIAYDETAETPVATIDCDIGMSEWGSINCDFNIAANAGLCLKSVSDAGTLSVTGSTIKGLELRNSSSKVVALTGTHIETVTLGGGGTTKVNLANNNRCLHGVVTVMSDATMTFNGGDMIPYSTTNDFTLNLYGTIDCGAYRQTLSAEGGNNVINLFDGASITGTGSANGGYTSILDIFQDQLFTVSGTVTIAGPIGFRNTTKLQVAPAEGATTATLVLENPVLRNASIDLQPGAQVQLPSTIAESKVITTARGKMIAVKDAETEGQKIYRTVEKAFTISIR